MGKETNEELKKDVAEMDAVFSELDGMVEGTDAPGTDAPGTDSPKTDAPSTEAPGTDAPSTDAPSTDAPSTDAPATDAPTTDAPKEETDRERELREENERLRGKVEDLSGPKTSAPKTTAPTTEAPIEEQDFVGDADLEELTGDPKKFNELLNKVYSKGISDTRAATAGVTESIPGTVRDSIEAQATLKEVTDKFYEKHKELKSFKKVVSVVFNEIAPDHSDKELPDVLELVATETKKRLELPARQPVGDKHRKQHRLPRKKGSQQRGTDIEPKGMDGELDDMDKALA